MPPRATPAQAWRSAYRSWRLEAGDAPSDLPPDPFNPSSGPSSSSKRSKAPVAAGGFVVEDDEEEEEEEQRGGSARTHDDISPYLPLSCIPDALSILSPAYEDDETLLAIFRDVAVPAPPDFDVGSASEGGAGGMRRGAARIKVVRWDDWGKVVEALQGPEEEQEEAVAEEEEQEEQEERPKTRRLRRRPAAEAQGGFVQEDAQSSEDQFSLEEEGDEDEEDEDDSDEYGSGGRSISRRKASSKASTPRKGVRGARGSKRKRKGADEEEDEDAPRELSEDQLEVLDEIWAMFEDRLGSIGLSLGPQGRMDRKHLEGILRSLNEKMGEKEIEEMLSEGAKLYVPLEGSNAVRRRRGGDESVGKEEFAGILLKARII